MFWALLLGNCRNTLYQRCPPFFSKPCSQLEASTALTVQNLLNLLDFQPYLLIGISSNKHVRLLVVIVRILIYTGYPPTAKRDTASRYSLDSLLGLTVTADDFRHIVSLGRIEDFGQGYSFHLFMAIVSRRHKPRWANIHDLRISIQSLMSESSPWEEHLIFFFYLVFTPARLLS